MPGALKIFIRGFGGGGTFGSIFVSDPVLYRCIAALDSDLLVKKGVREKPCSPETSSSSSEGAGSFVEEQQITREDGD